MTSNVIDLRTRREVDPILRRGDLVRIVSAEEEGEEVEELIGYTGVVTDVVLRWGEDTEAPGQAKHIMIAVPFELGWEEVSLPVDSIHRVLGTDADELRGYGAALDS